MMMMMKHEVKPASWGSVLPAILPGLLMLLSRSGAKQLDIPLMLLGYLYLGLLLIGLPLAWRRQRQFPAWGLLPAGLLTWFLVYFAGTLLAKLSIWLHFSPHLLPLERCLALLQVLLAAILLAVLLRGRRLPVTFWLVTVVILVLNLLTAIYYSQEHFDSTRPLNGILTYFAGSGIGPLEGLMLAGIGLLVARQHSELALLVVAGGHSYMLMDSDYLFGSPVSVWPGLPLYFMFLILVYLVVMPVAALRARSSLGRVLAVFLPVGLFHATRIIVPSLVLKHSIQPPWGEVILSANVLLSLLLAWTLYRPTSNDLHSDGELEEATLSTSKYEVV